MAQDLRITTLGCLQIEYDGAPVSGFISSKAQGLLVYLAVTGRPHSRDTLATLLWGDLPEGDARTSLRQALANLRRLAEPYLLINRDTVAWNRSIPYWLDVESFEAACRNAHPSTEQDLAALEAGAALYQGEFLQGFHVREAPDMEEWVLLQRERLHELAVQAMHTIAAEHTARHDYRRAIEYTGRLLALDPWREEAYRQMMALLFRTGQRSAALAHYKSCQRILAQEMGIEPSLETTLLYERIKSAKAGPPHNLPAQVTPFVGREKELTLALQRLFDPACRLLTLTGPGGIGKTRLALQVAGQCAESFMDGIYLVPLTDVENGGEDTLVRAIARAVHLAPQSPVSPRAQLVKWLRSKEVLLVLDSMEHLVGTGALLAEILRQAPQLRILVTSRERLNLRAECVIEVDGLPVPEDTVGAAAGASSALQLFEQSARRVQANFTLAAGENIAAVAHICALLGGLPLGIELAAPWVRVLDCPGIAREIERGLDFLSANEPDVPEGQRSLRAVFEHSWQLLSPAEQAVFSRLSLFRGGLGQEAAERIAGATGPLLVSLMDKSLLRRTAPGRFDLHEVMRQYGEAKLAESPDAHRSAQDLYCAYYGEFLQKREEPLQGKRQREAVAEIEEEVDNVRRAWGWMVERGDTDEIGRAVDGLYMFCEIRGRYQEGEEALGRAAALLRQAGGEREDLPSVPLARVLARQGCLAERLNAFAQARELLSSALATWQRRPVLPELALTLEGLSGLAIRMGEMEEGRRLAGEGLRLGREIDDALRVGTALYNSASIAYYQGDYTQSQELCQQALAVYRQAGSDKGIAVTVNMLALNALYSGRYAETKQLLQESLATSELLRNDPMLATGLYNLGLTDYMQREYDEARDCFRQSLAMERMVADPSGEALSLNGLAMVAYEQGNYEEAQQLGLECLALCRKIGDQYATSFCLHTLGDVTRAMGPEWYQASEKYYLQALNTGMQIQVVPAALHALVGLSALYAHKSSAERRQVLAWLDLILRHPGSIRVTHDRAERLWQELSAELSPEVVAEVQAQGAELTLEQVALGLANPVLAS